MALHALPILDVKVRTVPHRFSWQTVTFVQHPEPLFMTGSNESGDLRVRFPVNRHVNGPA
jgi:hypothetical protein